MIGRSINDPNGIMPIVNHAARQHFEVENGIVLIGGDAHIWPGPLTTAMRAFIKFTQELKPKLVILNGDVLDFPQISRHPHSWEEWPTVAQEIEAAQKALVQLEDAAPKAQLAWTLGNHDGRLETKIAMLAPELAKLKGVHLKDHFNSRWRPCWSAWVNNSTVIKHRLSGGTGALRMNVLKGGKHMFTNHLHAQHVWPVTDYNGTLYGVDTGCLADPDAEAFLYNEDGPLDWRAGFAVATYHRGELLPPELVQVWNKNSVVFRGQIIEVGHEAPQKKDRPKAEAPRRVQEHGRRGRGRIRRTRKRGR